MSDEEKVKNPLPLWFKLLRWCRWGFYALPLWYFPISPIPRLMAAVIIVFMDETLPGFAEKLLILSMLGGFIASWALYGLLSSFTVGFIIFLLWYIGGGIASYHWLHNQLHFLMKDEVDSPED